MGQAVGLRDPHSRSWRHGSAFPVDRVHGVEDFWERPGVSAAVDTQSCNLEELRHRVASGSLRQVLAEQLLHHRGRSDFAACNVLAICLCLCPDEVSWAGSAVLVVPGNLDDSRPGSDHPQLHIDALLGLAEHVYCHDFAISLFRLWHVLAAAVLLDSSLRAGRGRTRIDGCSRFGLYWRIILPLAKPALASLAIFTFRSQWNAFLWPLIVVNDTSKMPVQVGLSFFRGMYSVEWEVMLAGTLIALIPTLVVFALGQRFFTQGIALSGFGGR